MDSSKRKERGGNESLKGQGERRERSEERGDMEISGPGGRRVEDTRGAPGRREAGEGRGRERGGGPDSAHPEGPPLALSHSRPRVMLPRGCSPPVIRCSPSVLRPDRLLPLQRPWPGPRAASRLRLGPGFGFLQLRLGLHVRARGPWACSALPVPAPPPPFFTFLGLAGPRLACCRRGCLRRQGREKGEGVRSRPRPDRSPRYRPAPGWARG